MKKESRTVIFDNELNIEAYSFKGVMQKFPNHFHKHFVIGFIEKGERKLSCLNKEYIVGSGDITIFNPYDVHTCEQINELPLEYRCLNVSEEIMEKNIINITEIKEKINFSPTVITNLYLSSLIKELHSLITKKSREFRKEEIFILILEYLVKYHSIPFENNYSVKQSENIKRVCEFLEKNFDKNISLDTLTSLTDFSKYHLLRSFTKETGITPYGYLETVRIEKAKNFLEKGVSPAETAFLTGFSDQSHFSNFFKKFIGLTPKQYQNIFINKNKSLEETNE
ncbi:AraC family transcriptional regulator [uncultured Fusobacterium sp.]|uniref:AraC family transcriptional regulator n=1 Tax=uncultured Fusobacterium sp. TaxID=159267 RepID=UPI0025E7ABCA|nr:AraC family transcriptional regulator [uncultured Fusobacterium sp.]